MPHKWDVSPKDAIQIQQELRDKVSLKPLDRDVQTIAGADVSLNMFGKDIYAGIIVLSYPKLVPLEYALVQSRTEFPYIPGLLSFREVPVLLECFEHLKVKPDVVMIDGQGIAHPRRLGVASHFGILADIPTIGVAKSLLYGKEEGGRLLDNKTCEVLGAVLQSKPRTNPLIISPGHKITASESLQLVRTCLKGYRLPEPTRLAHKLVNSFRTGTPLQEYGEGRVYMSVTQ